MASTRNKLTQEVSTPGILPVAKRNDRETGDSQMQPEGTPRKGARSTSAGLCIHGFFAPVRKKSERKKELGYALPSPD